MSKSAVLRECYVKCLLCRGALRPQDAITTTVKGLLENGQVFQSLVTVCWFCTLEVDEPLKGLACLVPHNSTELQEVSSNGKKTPQSKKL